MKELHVDDWRNTLTHPDLDVVKDAAIVEVRYLFFFCVPEPRSDRQFSRGDEDSGLCQCFFRSAQLSLELHFLWPALTSDVSVSWAVLKNVFWCVSATATRVMNDFLKNTQAQTRENGSNQMIMAVYEQLQALTNNNDTVCKISDPDQRERFEPSDDGSHHHHHHLSLNRKASFDV